MGDVIKRMADLQEQVEFWKARASDLAELASDAEHVEQQRALARQRAKRRAQTLREQVEYWKRKAAQGSALSGSPTHVAEASVLIAWRSLVRAGRQAHREQNTLPRSCVETSG